MLAGESIVEECGTVKKGEERSELSSHVHTYAIRFKFRSLSTTDSGCSLRNVSATWQFQQTGLYRSDEQCSSIVNNCRQISTSRVFVRVLRIFLDFETGFGNARCVSETEIALRAAGFGRDDFDFSGVSTVMVVQSFLLRAHCPFSNLRKMRQPT